MRKRSSISGKDETRMQHHPPVFTVFSEGKSEIFCHNVKLYGARIEALKSASHIVHIFVSSEWNNNHNRFSSLKRRRISVILCIMLT